ncbi:MAG: hypothetical protein KIT07_09795 [Anaerolineales bacterium]|nr:hypothetical protein [Anaerolineales bacterium]
MRRALSLALLGLLLASCGQPARPAITDVQNPPLVSVILNVLTPPGSPANEPVQLDVVDLLTGLSFNRQAVNMQRSGDGSYATTLSVPAGSLLTYRYSRVSAAAAVDEVSATGEPIAYRSFLVSGAGHVVHDLIAAWADAPASTLPVGQVAGRITAADSGQPLGGIAVRAAGLATLSDAEGRFYFDGLPQGLHNMVLTDPEGRYQSFQQGALVAAGSQTPAELQLQPAALANVTFILVPSANSPAGVPVFLLGNLTALSRGMVLTAHDGGYSLTLQLPSGIDLRYKYSLGDGFWNAEHYAEGGFVQRQLIIPAGTQQLTVRDNLQGWTAGSSAPLWFDLSAPADSGAVYLQFKLLDWATPLPMWDLGGGRYTYVLYSPTNFGEGLEYRYCRDAACSQLEADAPVRQVNGNQREMQQIQDNLSAWQ